MIAHKTTRELWVITLGYLLVMLGILLPAIILWPDLNIIGKQLKPVVLMATILKNVLFRELIGALDKYDDYYALQAFFKGGNICGTAAAVFLGTGLIARERENQTIEFLLSRPVSTSRILFTKFSIAAVCVIVPIYLVAWIGIPLSAWIVDEHLSFTATTVAATHCSIFVLSILSLTTLCSVIFRVQAHAAATVGLFIVIQTAVYLIQTVRRFSYLKLADIEIYGPIMKGKLHMRDLFSSIQIWLLLGSLIVYLIADRLLRRIAL